MSTIITFDIITHKGYGGPGEWGTDKDWEEHRKRVEELKTKGEYGKEEKNTISFVYNPLFDGDLEGYKNNPKYKVTEI